MDMEFSAFLSSKNLDKDIAMAQCHVGPFENFVGKGPLTALPIEEPEQGLKGYLFFHTDEGGKEAELSVSVRVRPEVTKTSQMWKRSGLEKSYYNALENKWVIIPWQDPKKLQIGFLIWNSDGVEKCWINLCDLKDG